MKTTLLLLLVSEFLISCNPFAAESTVKDFIPGTYATSWSSQFSNVADTIIIEPLTVSGSEGYGITRRTRIEFAGPLSKKEPEYKITRWLGIYNKDNKTIIINSNGRVLSFDTNANEMMMGIVIYKKL